ncbi:MAG TPA: SHOCT domain-containing protein [Humibacillus xanthopallidus]|nr:SHOCT domain-containing protein [Humibacillus xanthopallidus]
MGLLRGVARTAVVAGTATAVSNRVSRRQAGRWAAQEQQAAPPQDYPPQQQYAEPPPQQYAPPPPPPAPEADTGVDLAALQQLGELRDAGVLTEAEFQVQKERILAR